jgi:hypothetical protein
MVAVTIRLLRPARGIQVRDGGNLLSPVVPQGLTATPEGFRFSLPAGKLYEIRAVNGDSPGAREKLVKAVHDEIHEEL